MRIQNINIIKPDKVAGISVHFIDQQNATFHLSIVQRTKGKIEIVHKTSNLSTIEQVIDNLPKSIPVILGVTGKVVLNKLIRKEEVESMAEQYIPSHQQSDFYGYEYQFGDNTALSLCRRTTINSLINTLKKKGYDIVDLTIGPFVVGGLWHFELTREEVIHVPGGIVSYNSDSGDMSYQTEEEAAGSLLIEGEKLDLTGIIPYTNALCWLVNFQNGAFYGDAPEGIVTDYQFKHIVNRLKYPVLALFLGILLINFFVFDSYRKKEALLDGQLDMNAGLIARLDSLEKELKAKESYIEFIGENRTYYSLLLDQIAATIPSKIGLQRLDVNPITKKIKEGEPVRINKEISIAGWAGNSLVLNEWTKSLAKKDWIKDVVVIDYHKNTDNSKGEFLVQILLKE